MKRFRWDNMLPLYNIPVRDNVQMNVTENYIFQLFPNKMGYAENYGIKTGTSAPPIRNFNWPYTH